MATTSYSKETLAERCQRYEGYLEILLKKKEWKQYEAVLWSIGCYYGTAWLNSKDFPNAKVFQRVKEGLIMMRDKNGIHFKIEIDRRRYV